MDRADNTPLGSEDLSYNLFLYRKRMQAKLKKRAFARMLGIRPFRYRLIENGYIKPTDEEVGKISACFGIDFSWYLEGFRNYPTELDNKKFLRIVNFAYYLFTKKGVRIACFVLALLSLLLTIAGFILQPKFDYTRVDVYDEQIVSLRDAVVEKGTKNFSMFRFSYPLVSRNIVFDEVNERSVIIKSSYDENLMSLFFNEIIWYGDYRLYLDLNTSDAVENIRIWTISVYNYKLNETNLYDALEAKGEFLLLTDDAKAKEALKVLESFDVCADFDALIKEELGLDQSFEEVVATLIETEDYYLGIYIKLWLATMIALLCTCVFWFLFGYAMIYKKEKDANFSFNRSDKLLGFKPKFDTVKKDLRFTPFLPETFLRVIGIALVFLGSFRLIYYTMNVGLYSSGNILSANELYSVQLLGLFLIFFINFDVYMDDNRLFRNLMLYPIVYILIYGLEATLMTSIAEEQSILTLSLERFTFPNPFGAAACYFLIMVFLFYTPRYVTTKKRLIVYRSMAVLPIALIIVSFLLSNIKTIFGLQFENYWEEFLFRDDRFSLSLLAITYLVSLFFMRLHFKRRFGEENAYRYFMGNRYILAKNALAAGLIIVIWAIEMIASTNATMSALGFGQNKYVIVLAPLVFFYHPHKNARNTKVDVLLITVYALVLVMLYISAGIVAILSLV